MKLSYFHVAADVPKGPLPDVAIVIDVLRATTTIAFALNNGADCVQTFSDLNELRQKASEFNQSSCLLLGERGGKKLEGFDLGDDQVTQQEPEGLSVTSDGKRRLIVVAAPAGPDRGAVVLAHLEVCLALLLVDLGVAVLRVHQVDLRHGHLGVFVVVLLVVVGFAFLIVVVVRLQRL